MITIALVIDIVGISIGLFSIATIIRLGRALGGGGLGVALNLFVWGIVFMMTAFTWTIVFTRLKLFVAPPIDVHHLLMTSGMILFVLAARKFSSLAQP